MRRESSNVGLSLFVFIQFHDWARKVLPATRFCCRATSNFWKRSSRRRFERRMFRGTTSALKYSCRFDMSTPTALCGEPPPLCSLCCRGTYKNSLTTAADQNAAELCTFVTLVEPFFADQRDFLEISAVALRAGHVHLVTPCSPTSVWEESSAVVTFLIVVNPQPRPAGLVACLRSTRPRSGHFLSPVQEQLAISFLGLANRRRNLLR